MVSVVPETTLPWVRRIAQDETPNAVPETAPPPWAPFVCDDDDEGCDGGGGGAMEAHGASSWAPSEGGDASDPDGEGSGGGESPSGGEGFRPAVPRFVRFVRFVKEPSSAHWAPLADSPPGRRGGGGGMSSDADTEAGAPSTAPSGPCRASDGAGGSAYEGRAGCCEDDCERTTAEPIASAMDRIAIID